jgi:hypothetical protein
MMKRLLMAALLCLPCAAQEFEGVFTTALPGAFTSQKDVLWCSTKIHATVASTTGTAYKYLFDNAGGTGHWDWSIYKADGSPAGSPGTFVVSSSSQVIGSSGFLTATGTGTALLAGNYWYCTNMDNNTDGEGVSSGVGADTYYVTATTYGTFPANLSGTMTHFTTNKGLGGVLLTPSGLTAVQLGNPGGANFGNSSSGHDNQAVTTSSFTAANSPVISDCRVYVLDSGSVGNEVVGVWLADGSGGGPGTLKCGGTPAAMTVGEWNTFTCSFSPVNGSSYFVGANTDTASAQYGQMTTTGTVWAQTLAFGSLANLTTATSSIANKYLVYCDATVTPGGVPRHGGSFF